MGRGDAAALMLEEKLIMQNATIRIQNTHTLAGLAVARALGVVGR
jgi:hypothetical protein